MICSREFVIKKMTELMIEPKKKYSQNFLTDYETVKKAVDSLNLDDETTVVEIGPGLGALTEEILNRNVNLYAYEIDSEMVNHLSNYFAKNTKFHLIEGDFLKQDLSQFNDNKLAFISNVPYNVTTPIIERVLLQPLKVSCFTFMIQKEVSARINAKKGSDEYSPLSIFISYVGKVETVTKVTREKFIPAPNVDSIILKITFREERDYAFERKLYKLLNASFAMRRKNILNNMAAYVGGKDKANAILAEANINPLYRAEQLTLEDFVRLVNVIEK